MRNGFRLWVEQFIRSIQKNKSAKKEANSPKLIQSLHGYTGIYDGECHSITIVSAENCKIEYGMDLTNWEPTVPSICDAGVHKVYVKVSSDKKVEFGSAIINIQKRKITLTSSSEVKEYDGTPIESSEVTISGDGTVEGHLLIARAIGTQRLVGKCINSIEYQFINDVVEDNYCVNKEEGILEVIDRKEKYHISVNGKSAQYKYDGNLHEISGFENLAISINGIQYTICGINSYASLVHAGSISTSISGACIVEDSAGNNVSDQFQVTVIPGELTITPRKVIIKSASDSQEYNGRELQNDSIEVSGDGFIEGEVPFFTVSGKQRLVGNSYNRFDYKFPEKVVSSDYLISVEYGRLEVHNRSEKYSVNIRMNNGEYVYDAKEHVVSGIEDDAVLIDGVSYSVVVIDEPVKGINAGNYAHGTVNEVHIYDSENCDVSEQFDIYVQPGTLLIKKRNLVLKSNSAVKEYDGTPLTKSSIQILGSGLADGDSITGFVDGSQLVVGKSRNSISYYFDRSELEDNYDTILDEGTLEVIDRKFKLLVTLEANSAEYLYDGTVHTVRGFRNNTVIVNENEFTVSGVSAYASLLHAGTTYTTALGKPIITDHNGNDVTEQFELYIIQGTLLVHPRKVTIASQSASKEYDGTILTAPDIRITGDGFVSEETPSIVVSGKQLHVGSSKNMFSYVYPEDVHDADYQISVKYGTLKISNRQERYPIDIHLNSGEFIYDANEHIVEGVKENAVMINDVLYSLDIVDRPVKEIDAGNYVHDTVDSVHIYDSERYDVSNQFTVHIHPGMLLIKKRSIVLKSNSATKEYDGTPLKDNKVQILGSGLAEGDWISVFAIGYQQYVGKSRNKISYYFVGDLEKNYSITLDEGTFEIASRKEKLQVILKVNNAEYTYDGKIHYIKEYPVKKEIINGEKFTVSGVYAYVSQRHVGFSETIIVGRPIVTDEMEKDVSDQFDVQVVPGTIRINPRIVKLTSGSTSREYNGAVLRMPEIEISGDGFVLGEEPSFTISGEQRLVGHSANFFEYSFPKHVFDEDYKIITEYGKLEVNSRQEKYSVDIHLNGGSYKYDSNEHVASGIVESTILVDGNSYTIDISDEPVSGVNVGEYVHATVNEMRIYDYEQCDVSNQFEINAIPGTLHILPRSVTIKSASASKEYDGTDLKASDIYITGDGFIQGEEPSIVVSGKQQLVGDSENIFSVSWSDYVDKNNYAITTNYGKLEVWDRTEKYSVAIHLCDADYLFDTKEHIASGVVEQEVIVNGIAFKLKVVDAPAAGTEPGEYKHDKVISTSVFDAENNDVTKQFSILINPGKLTIRPNPEYCKPKDEKIDDYDVAIHNILNRMSGEKPSKSLDGIKKYSRKELEALYEDTKELIVSDGKILPFCDYLLEKKKEDSDLAILHNRIVEEIQNVVLLSEIEINDSEYKILITYARQKFRTSWIKTDIVFADVLFSVAMIQIGVRKYANNYWPQVENALGRHVGQNERKWLGNTVTKTLLSLGKPVYSETEYVTNILMHCIVTDSYALRFFDYLFSYYRLDLERDISGLQKTDINYICDSIINPYSKRKQLLSDYLSMSIRADKENCSTMIQKSLYMIDHSFWDEEISEDESLKGRMRERFNEWLDQSQFYNSEKQKNKHQIGNGRRERLFRTPHLKVDLNKREFVVILPQQMIPVHEETKIPEVRWFIISKTNREYTCRLEEGYSGYKTREIQFYVKPDEIFDKVVYLLFADKTLIRSFSWDSHKSAFFTDRLDWVSGDKLEIGKAYAFCQQVCSIESKAILYKGWFRGLRYYEFDLKDGDFVFVKGEDNYYIGKVPAIGLNENGIVKGVTITNEKAQNLPIYANDPQLVIQAAEDQLKGTAVIINGKISRLSDIDFVDIHVGNTADIKYYFISTTDLKGICEGYNKIVVDYPNSQKQLCFEYYLSSGFFYEYDGAPYLYKDKGTLVFMGRETVEFSMSLLDEDILEVILESEGTLHFKVPLLLTSWDRENWSYQKEPDIWHGDFRNMLYIRYPSDAISLFVDGINKDISRCSFSVMSDGIFNCDLTKLKSYFSQKAMLDYIVFEAGEKRLRMLKIVLKSYFAGMKLTADQLNNKVYANMQIVGKNDYYADLYCEDELVAEKEPVENGKATFSDIEIETADYTVKLYESEGDFGFDDDYRFVGYKTCSLINLKDLLGGRMKVLSINDHTGNELKFNSEYDYYIFPEKQVSDNTYEAIVSGVFRSSSVMYASRATVQIKDLANSEKVSVSKANIKGEKYVLAFDKEKESIIDILIKQQKNNEYLYLDPEKYDWKVRYIGGNSKLLEKSRIKMEETERLRNRPFTIWKN